MATPFKLDALCSLLLIFGIMLLMNSRYVYGEEATSPSSFQQPPVEQEIRINRRIGRAILPPPSPATDKPIHVQSNQGPVHIPLPIHPPSSQATNKPVHVQPKQPIRPKPRQPIPPKPKQAKSPKPKQPIRSKPKQAIPPKPKQAVHPKPNPGGH